MKQFNTTYQQFKNACNENDLPALTEREWLMNGSPTVEQFINSKGYLPWVTRYTATNEEREF